MSGRGASKTVFGEGFYAVFSPPFSLISGLAGVSYYTLISRDKAPTKEGS